jgi:hypothetical protein
MREHKTSAEHACINTRARLIADLGDETARAAQRATWTTLLRADGSPNLMPLDRFPYGSDIRSGWV